LFFFKEAAFNKSKDDSLAKAALKFTSLLLLTLLSIPTGAGAAPLPEMSSRPGIWTRDETTLTLQVLTGAALFTLLDEPLRRSLQKERSDGKDDLADAIATLSHPVATFAVSGLLWGVGNWSGDPYGAETGLLAFEALTLSQGMSLALKVGVGRQRPDARPGAEEDAANFEPFSLSDSQHSFPSSHTSSAFALAAVLARRSTASYAPLGYYSAATLVGLTRLYQDKHWGSDVIVGALIGELSARLVLNWRLRKNSSLTLAPYVGQGGGVVATMRW
jgi:membrane-associated phospholipid phosphatase